MHSKDKLKHFINYSLLYSNMKTLLLLIYRFFTLSILANILLSVFCILFSFILVLCLKFNFNSRQFFLSDKYLYPLFEWVVLKRKLSILFEQTLFNKQLGKKGRIMIKPSVFALLLSCLWLIHLPPNSLSVSNPSTYSDTPSWQYIWGYSWNHP